MFAVRFHLYLSVMLFCFLCLDSFCSQVVVSGPAGFVFRAEGILAELGIPPQAVVLLD